MARFARRFAQNTKVDVAWTKKLNSLQQPRRPRRSTPTGLKHRTHGQRSHAKFQPPLTTGLAVHREQRRVQNKGNGNIM
mgnify:CR=1 FL=1